MSTIDVLSAEENYHYARAHIGENPRNTTTNNNNNNNAMGSSSTSSSRHKSSSSTSALSYSNYSGKDTNHLDDESWEDHVHSKRQPCSQAMVYWMIIILSCALVLLLVGLLAPLLELQHRDSVATSHRAEVEEVVANNWGVICRDAVIDAISTAFSVGGFILGNIETIPPYSGTVEERLAGQHFNRFYNYSYLANSTVSDIKGIATAPGGVIDQCSPPDFYVTGFDLLATAVADHIPLLTYITSTYRLVGPLSLQNDTDDTPYKGAESGYVVVVHQPIYFAATVDNFTLENFWGFVIVTLGIDSVLSDYDIAGTMAANDMDYVMYSWRTTDMAGKKVPTQLIVMDTSLPDNTTTAEIQSFIGSSDVTTRSVLPDQISWYIAVRLREKKKHLTRTNIAIIVATVVGGTIVLGVIALVLAWYFTKEYDAFNYAPRAPPFAVVTLGACHGEELWNLASDQMVVVTEKMLRVVQKYMMAGHGCEVPQIHPYTFSCVMPTVDAAVRMMTHALEELQRHPVDEPLRMLLGDEDGKLLLSCAVHWCTDAKVTINHFERSYRYDGPDVVYSARMWPFAAPNTITISNAARQATKRSKTTKWRLFSSVFLRGVRQRQNLFIPADGSAERIKEALLAASKRLRRAREKARGGVFLHNLSSASSFSSSSVTNADSGKSDSLHGVAPLARNSGVVPNISFLGASGHGPVNTSFSDSRLVHAPQIPFVCMEPNAVNALLSPLVPPQPPPSAATLTATTSVSVSVPVDGGHEDDDAPLPVTAMVTMPPADVLAGFSSSSTSSDSNSSTASTERGKVVVRPDGRVLMSRHHSPPPAQPAGASPKRPTPKRVTPKKKINMHSSSSNTNTPLRLDPNSELPALPTIIMSSPPPEAPLPQQAAQPPPPAATAAAVTVPPLMAPLPISSSTSELSSAATGSPVVLAGKRRKQRPLAIEVPRNPLVAHGGSVPTAPIEVPPTVLRAGGTAELTPRRSDSDLLLSLTHRGGGGGGGGGGGNDSGHTYGSGRPVLLDGGPLHSGGAISYALHRPNIPPWLDAALRNAFEQQAVALDVSYDAVQVIVYYFFASFKLLFRPLAAPERANIFRRLVTAFGVPQQNILDHLAARCTIRYLQQHEEAQSLLWDRQLQLQEDLRERPTL